MFVDFHVFPSPQAAEIIKAIEAEGFNVYVSRNSDNHNIRRCFPNLDRMGLCWGKGEYGVYTEGVFDTPLFCVSLQEDYYRWADVYQWLDWVVFGATPSGITHEELGFEKPFRQTREYTPSGEEIVYEGVKSHCLSTPPDEIDLKNGYSFDCYHDEALDIKYYEITAPSSATPFTVVVNNFSSKDDTYLFSDIYASSAWASNRMECRYDFHFLTVLWKYLDMPGEFTMDIVKRRVDACYPDRVKSIDELEPEPSVYRRTMTSVMGMKRKNLLGREVY